MIYELKVIYGSQKSFYNKANVLIADNIKVLTSYNTEVCKIENNKPTILIDTLSQTTLKHIKEFLLQAGFKADTRKHILNDYK